MLSGRNYHLWTIQIKYMLRIYSKMKKGRWKESGKALISIFQNKLCIYQAYKGQRQPRDFSPMDPLRYRAIKHTDIVIPWLRELLEYHRTAVVLTLRMPWRCSEILLPITATAAYQSQYCEAEFFLPVLLNFFLIFTHPKEKISKDLCRPESSCRQLSRKDNTLGKLIKRF